MSKNKIVQILVVTADGAIGSPFETNSAQLDTFADIDVGDVILGYSVDQLDRGTPTPRDLEVSVEHERPGSLTNYLDPIDKSANDVFTKGTIQANATYILGHSNGGLGPNGNNLHVLPGMRVQLTWSGDPGADGHAELFLIVLKEFS